MHEYQLIDKMSTFIFVIKRYIIIMKMIYCIMYCVQIDTQVLYIQ